jgi:hypothetical protein
MRRGCNKEFLHPPVIVPMLRHGHGWNVVFILLPLDERRAAFWMQNYDRVMDEDRAFDGTRDALPVVSEHFFTADCCARVRE